jgi:type II secretory pathway component PulF
MTVVGAATIDTAAAERLAAGAQEMTRWQARRARWSFRLSTQQRSTFYKWLATLRARGQRLDVALATIYYIDTNGGENTASPLARAIPGWIAAMKFDGEPIDRVLRGWVSPAEQMILSALAKTGLSAPALAHLAATTKTSQKLIWSLVGISAQVYLTLLVGIALGYVFASLLPDLLLGVPIKLYSNNIIILKAAGEYLTRYGLLVLALLIVAPVAIVYSLSRLTGPYRHRLDAWPIYQQYRDIQGALMLRAVATLIAAGKGFFEALELLQDVTSPYLAYHIEAILEHQSSRPYAAMRETGLEFPNGITITTLGVVMEGPDPSKALLEFSDEWQEYTNTLIADSGQHFLSLFRGVLYGLALWLVMTFNDIYNLFERIQ